MENSFRTKTGEDNFTDSWFAQYTKPTKGHVTADGNTIRFPFWLHSEEFMVYGGRRTAVGGSGSWRTLRTSPRRRQCSDLRVVQQVADSNSGGAYHETWYYTCATPKGQKLSLPYDSPMSLLAADPKALMWVLRVICGDNDANPGAGQNGISRAERCGSIRGTLRQQTSTS